MEEEVNKHNTESRQPSQTKVNSTTPATLKDNATPISKPEQNH